VLAPQYLVCKRKLESKKEALLILSKELDTCQQERDQYKLMANQLRERHQSLKKKYRELIVSISRQWWSCALDEDRERGLHIFVLEKDCLQTVPKWDNEEAKKPGRHPVSSWSPCVLPDHLSVPMYRCTETVCSRVAICLLFADMDGAQGLWC
jgi:hypothetical protein